MQTDTAIQIRDFKVRGNYFNQRSLASRKSLHYSKKAATSRVLPGYSPPEVEIEFEGEGRQSIVVSEVDIPFLCAEDFEQSKRYLGLILRARGGDERARSQLLDEAQSHPWLARSEKQPPPETQYVVPCTSTQPHSAEEISQKGSILLRLSQEGYPVPDFVVLAAPAYVEREQHLETHFTDAVEKLESLTLQSLGVSADPLVFAIRCATPRYIPGVMDTYLNVGVTETTLPYLEKIYGSVVAQRMFINNLRNLCNLIGQGRSSAFANVATRDLSADQVSDLLGRLLSTIRAKDKRLVEDPWYQAAFFVRQAYEQFEEHRELVLTLCRGAQYSPSLILQKMVCTIRHQDAYAGVVSSRHTQSGIGVELQTAHNIFGEEIMTGTAEIESTAFKNRQEIKQKFPGVYHFAPHLGELEREFESPVTIEFAVEATDRYQSFALLQLNETGMAGRASLAATLDLYKSGAITRKRVTELIRPYHIKQLSSDSIDEDSFEFLNSFCNGIAVLPRSAVSAQIYFSGESALNAKSRGEKACLCKKTFVPTDTVIMREMDAILSLTSAAIHVVTICQSLGIPALLSLETNGVTLQDDTLMNSAGKAIKEGDWITISSRRRAVYEGVAKYKPARLLRYMRGENVEFAPGEQELFDSIAYNYRYYQQIIKGMTVDQISTLDEITRLVNVELRANTEDASTLVNSWVDEREELYVDELFKSDIGDHLAQSRVFEFLSLERKMRFFNRALAKCARERISGYDAGAFMLGRFLSVRYPVVFWKGFNPVEISLLINEWVLFEKYMQLLHNMGERKLLQARKKILQEGLDQLHLHSGNVRSLITMKLAGVPLEDVKQAFPDWTDAQSPKVVELLQQPFSAFYDFGAKWSLAELEKICAEAHIPVPQPTEV